MNDSIAKIFEDVELKAQKLAKSWREFRVDISLHLPETYYPELQELSEKLDSALDVLIKELHNPTLTLATTGTTSSGKSTLVNFLCGAEIVPVAVSEMSAGAVTIEYAEEKSLVIHETPGAIWECGEWHHVSENEIYYRLDRAMLDYIDNRKQNQDLGCPQVTIRYPFRMLKEGWFDLPKGTIVKVLDLPGLAHVNDEGNAAVIRQCRQALCIVTYNSAETDENKTRTLLQEVVQQVKELGGSPARMLFVLNRIDVFRADRNWPHSEERFVNKTIESIKHELTDYLREYTDEIERLQVVKLSSWPALLAIDIQSADSELSTNACEKADKHFNMLIDDQILDDLPRRADRWSQHDRTRVTEELRKNSYSEEFQEHLKQHIRQHFPQLVIPQLIDKFNVSAGNAVSEWAIQTTAAILNSSQERYEQECERINHIRICLDKFLEENNQNLINTFQEINLAFEKFISGEMEDDPAVFLEQLLQNLLRSEIYNEFGEQKLYPLYGWQRELSKGTQKILEVVTSSLDSGTVDLENPYFNKASTSSVKLLENNLKRLIHLGYTDERSKNGYSIEAKTKEQKQELKQLNEELDELSIHLNQVLEQILRRIFDIESERIYDTVEKLFQYHVSYLEEGANQKIKRQNIHGLISGLEIKFPGSEISKVDNKLKFKLSFQSGFAVTSGTWKERITNVSYERRWSYFLKLLRKKVETIRYESRVSDNATIPSSEDLIDSWILQFKSVEPKIYGQISSWLLEQVSNLKEAIEKVTHEVIERYQARLDEAHKEITQGYEMKLEIWQPIQEEAKKLSDKFSDLRKNLQ